LVLSFRSGCRIFKIEAERKVDFGEEICSDSKIVGLSGKSGDRIPREA